MTSTIESTPTPLDRAPTATAGAEAPPSGGASRQPAAVDGVAEVCASVLGALERLFSIGILYPAGHARCVDVATAFRQEMRRSLAGASALTIDAGRDSLAIQECMIAPGGRSAARLHGIMTVLGISRLEIDSAASPADLYGLVSLLLRLKHEAETTRGFRRLEFDSLPATVRLTLREFSHRVEGVGEECRNGPPRGVAGPGMGGLGTGDLDTGIREAFGDLVEKSFAQLGDAAVARAPGGAEQPPGRRLLPVGGAGAGGSAGAAGAGGLAGVADPAGAAGAAETGDPTGVAPPPASVDPAGAAEGCRLPLSDLRRRLEAGAAGQPPVRLEAEKAEHLSVLLQLLSRRPQSTALTALDDLLGQCLAGRVPQREQGVLVGALSGLLGSTDPALVDAALPHLLRPLRRTGLLGPLLLEACRTAPTHGCGAAWPHLVNEILLGLEGADVKTLQTLAGIAASLPEGQMRRQLPRLEPLEALREHRLARRLFQSPAPRLSSLFALLLYSSQGDLIGGWLLETLRAHAPAWAGAPALNLMGDYAPGYRGFLARLLRESSRGAVSTDLLAAAGGIIVRGLRVLPRPFREASWVSEAVRALGVLPAPNASELLSAIQSERRLIVLHAWPRACRDAAAEAQRGAEALRGAGAPHGAATLPGPAASTSPAPPAAGGAEVRRR